MISEVLYNSAMKLGEEGFTLVPDLEIVKSKKLANWEEVTDEVHATFQLVIRWVLAKITVEPLSPGLGRQMSIWSRKASDACFLFRSSTIDYRTMRSIRIKLINMR